jgi:hypothetical protein
MVPMNDIVIIQNLISILEVGEPANAVRADLLWHSNVLYPTATSIEQCLRHIYGKGNNRLDLDAEAGAVERVNCDQCFFLLAIFRTCTGRGSLRRVRRSRAQRSARRTPSLSAGFPLSIPLRLAPSFACQAERSFL